VRHNTFAARAPPRTPLRELTGLPGPLAGFGGGGAGKEGRRRQDGIGREGRKRGR